MKLKKTRKERKCYQCKSLINKGDLYMNTVVHYMRIPVSMCQCCLENK